MDENVNPMERASSHLYRIKKRALHLRKILEGLRGQAPSYDFAINIDHAFFDIRKLIEELMLLSLCAHDFASVELTQKLRKEWHAERLMSFLERLNPQFFPEAIDVLPSDEDDIAGIFMPSDRHVLTRPQAAEAYNFCGGILHASNKRDSSERLSDLFDRATLFEGRAAELLNCFQIDISGKGLLVLGQLGIDKPDEPPELFHAPYVIDRGAADGP